jgi:pepF/M3 family oligoendopeptidase
MSQTPADPAAVGAPPAAPLPRWDMEAVFPGPTSPEADAAFHAVTEGIERLAALFDAHGVATAPEAAAAAGRPRPDQTGAAAAAAFEAVAAAYNALLEQARTLGAYLRCLVAEDSRDEAAQARLSALQQHLAHLSLLGTRFTAWVGTLDVEALLEASAGARAHEFLLRKARQQAEHLMAPGEEALAAELGLSGGVAWAKLHGNFTSQLLVPWADGESLPMSQVRNLAFDPDAGVRKAAYEAELTAWERAAVPLAAALNGVKGEANTLARRRGWDGGPLDIALFDNHIDRATLDAMFAAARDSFPDFRRYLRAKARALGTGEATPSGSGGGLAWFDLFAPVGESGRDWGWDEATTFLEEQFGRYSPKMRAFARRAVAERWIDAAPREGKRDGAFCSGLRGDESRILMNYQDAWGGVSTLAHELGHGYHNLCLAGRTALQRGTPMTLAETASIFCETIIRQAALDAGDRQEQVAILEASLQGACQVVVDITSRFLFEQRVLERRRERELSVRELCDLMENVQRETYGDGLDSRFLHPYMWAVKGHYYSAGFSFYNFPYMFGLLFGLGLYARYERDPDAFRAGYDDLLSSTGMADAATLAARFDIDLRTPDFWRSSLALIRDDIDRFEALVSSP